MTKSAMLHELYIQCKDINYDESGELIAQAPTSEEKEFIRVVTDFALQQKQKLAIAEKRF